MSGWWRLFRPRALLGVLPVLVFLAVRQMLGPGPAIVSGFGTSLVVFVLNREDRAGAVLGLSTLALVIGAVASLAALWLGDERVYFGGDPAWDFAMVAILLISTAVRRPFTGVLTFELLPALRFQLDARHPVFYVTTLLALGMFLFHGAVRLSLLLRVESIEQYLLLSRAVQWSTGLLLLLLIAWLVKRAAEASRVRAADHRQPLA